jgi:hypothetical protein
MFFKKNADCGFTMTLRAVSPRQAMRYNAELAGCSTRTFAHVTLRAVVFGTLARRVSLRFGLAVLLAILSARFVRSRSVIARLTSGAYHRAVQVRVSQPTKAHRLLSEGKM